MNPRPFGLYSAYPLFIAAAIVVGTSLLVRLARRAGLALHRLFAVEVVLLVAALTGAVLYNLIETGALHQFGARSYLSSGMRYPGALIGMVLVLPLLRYLLAGFGLAAFLDLVAPVAAVGMGIIRGGCFMMGCCYGYPSDLPWAIRYPPLSQVARHQAVLGLIEPGAWSLPVQPLHIYFGLASFAVAGFLFWYAPRKTIHGELLLLFLIAHEWSKGSLEFLRPDPPGHSVAHLRFISLAVAAVATAIFVARRNGSFTRVFPAMRSLTDVR